MEYKIIERSGSRDIEESVKVYLEMGWKPLGGVAVSMVHGSGCWAQAMIKEAPYRCETGPR